MFTVSVYLRNYLVEVARHRYGSLGEALHGRVELLEQFRRQGLKIRVTSVRRTTNGVGN